MAAKGRGKAHSSNPPSKHTDADKRLAGNPGHVRPGPKKGSHHKKK